MTISTAETLYDFIGEESGSAKPTGDATNKVSKHREFKLAATDSEQQLFLTFNDLETGTYHIPLGKLDSHEKTKSNNHKNIIVPVIPLTYNTAFLSEKMAAVPREGGYIYIYKGDFLWRELRVIKNGKYVDVNLHKYQGKDMRPANSGDSDSRILMPFKIAGKSEILTICISEVQWSWARINTMGGMDPEDFRINKKNPPLLAEACGITKSVAKYNRNNRMQEIDLSGHDSGFPTKEAIINRARIECSNNATSTNYLLKAHANSSIAVAYLHDPLGIAKNNVDAYHEIHSELVNVVEHMKMHEHFKSGVVAYHTFFNKTLHATKTESYESMRRGTVEYEVYKKTDDTSKVFRDAYGEINKTYLEESTLAVSIRKKLRKKIRELKAEHVNWLKGQIDGVDLKLTNPDLVTVNDALLDYAELPPPYYCALWSSMYALIHFLNHDPSRIDGAIDLKKNII